METKLVNAAVKITVLRRMVIPEFDVYKTGKAALCERFKDGQEFISKGVNMPEGFCSWAWTDIQKYVLTLARGGNLLSSKPGNFVTCCTDGYRPVFFHIQRIEE